MPICSKIFEKMVVYCSYDFLDQNSVLNANQSGFRSGNFCMHQLITITYNIFLNGESSKWKNVNAEVQQGSVLGPIFFLIYINDLPQGLHFDVKLFADDTSLFSVIHDAHASSATLNNDLVKIQEWTYN